MKHFSTKFKKITSLDIPMTLKFVFFCNKKINSNHSQFSNKKNFTMYTGCLAIKSKRYNLD